jgi:hypothetical protein
MEGIYHFSLFHLPFRIHSFLFIGFQRGYARRTGLRVGLICDLKDKHLLDLFFLGLNKKVDAGQGTLSRIIMEETMDEVKV